MTSNDHTAQIRRLSAGLTDWLNTKALPIWQEAGTDIASGECFEAIDLTTRSAVSAPRRARVVPRQIYSFLEGASLGWDGPAEELAEGLYRWHLEAFQTDAGYFAAAVDQQSTIVDSTFDLYNQAFAVFGFAQIASALPRLKAEAEDTAKRLLDYLRAHYAHPEAGFREANPDKVPLCSNPHMHLFEASLAWEATSDDPVWANLADEIAELALSRFIDPVSGGLREYFERDWSPMSGDQGKVMEPGHQFEWAWLLVNWGQSREDASALTAARRLYDIGWTYGIDENRGVAFMALNDDFTVRDPLARLWGQTEWIKAAIAMARISQGVEKATYLADIPDAVQALKAYLESAPDGLWTDKLSPDGRFKEEPAPASSLYHIVCAISELDSFMQDL